MSVKYAYKKRTFLNDDITLSAFIIASVEKFQEGELRRGVFCYPTLDISDCSNKVSLDFCFHGEAGMKASHKKLKRLQKVINEFTAAFEAEMEEYQKTPKEEIKKEKKKK